MPSRPKTVCRHCRKIIEAGSGGLCEGCKADTHTHYNKYNRDKDSQKFYNSGRWRRLRNYKIKKDPLCELCLKKDLIAQAKIADHIIPRDEGGPDTLENLQSLCVQCERKKHKRGAIKNNHS